MWLTIPHSTSHPWGWMHATGRALTSGGLKKKSNFWRPQRNPHDLARFRLDDPWNAYVFMISLPGLRGSPEHKRWWILRAKRQQSHHHLLGSCEVVLSWIWQMVQVSYNKMVLQLSYNLWIIYCYGIECKWSNYPSLADTRAVRTQTEMDHVRALGCPGVSFLLFASPKNLANYWNSWW